MRFEEEMALLEKDDLLTPAERATMTDAEQDQEWSNRWCGSGPILWTELITAVSLMTAMKTVVKSSGSPQNVSF